jgi:hypothetical protein
MTFPISNKYWIKNKKIDYYNDDRGKLRKMGPKTDYEIKYKILEKTAL